MRKENVAFILVACLVGSVVNYYTSMPSSGAQGALTSVYLLSRAFCAIFGGHFEFQIRGLIVRSLEPKFQKSWTGPGTGGRVRKFSDRRIRSLRAAPSDFRNFGSAPEN